MKEVNLYRICLGKYIALHNISHKQKILSFLMNEMIELFYFYVLLKQKYVGLRCYYK